MKHGYVGCTQLAGVGYGDPADVVAQEANKRSMDMEPSQELVSFDVHAPGVRPGQYVVHMVFRWPLEGA